MGVVSREVNLWKKKTIIIKFKNPNLLSKWKVSCTQILHWAGRWYHDPPPNYIPNFDLAKENEEADVVVELNEIGRNSSRCGDTRECTADSDSPVWLDLSRGDGRYKEHLVIHQFGHVLGLGHEHQRPDFWAFIRPYINKDRMSIETHQQWEVDDSLVVSGERATSYDHNSVMHYWFRKEWLTNGYDDTEKITYDVSLSEDIKNALKGVHKRAGSLVIHPSKLDLELLNRIYGPISEPSIKMKCIDTTEQISTAVPRVPQSVGPAGSLSKQPHTDSAYVEEDFEIDHSKYCLIDLPKNCDDMCKLAQMVIPEFDPTSGNGYTEFLEPQFIKADQRIVLQDENDRLFAKSGARYFECDDEEGLLVIPPKLNPTKWKHMFVQSTSNKISGSSFLYFNSQASVSSHLTKEQSKQLTSYYRYLLLTPNVVSLSCEKDGNGRHVFRIGVIEILNANELPNVIIYETVNKWVKIPVQIIEEGELVAFSGPYEGGCNIHTEGLNCSGSLGINIDYEGCYRLISAAHVLTQHRAENIGKQIFDNRCQPMNVTVEGHKEVKLYESIPPFISDDNMSKRDLAWARIDRAKGLQSISLIGNVKSIRLPDEDDEEQTVQFFGGASLRVYKDIIVKNTACEHRIRVNGVKFGDEVKDCYVFYDDLVRLEFSRETVVDETYDADVGFPRDIKGGDSGSAIVANDNCVIALFITRAKIRKIDERTVTCSLYASKLLD